MKVKPNRKPKSPMAQEVNEQTTLKTAANRLEMRELPEHPLSIEDPPEVLPEITKDEIVAFANTFHILRIARADFEARRAALTMKLLRGCPCEESDYFASLDEHGNIVVEDTTSLEPITNRKIIDRQVIPSGGAA